MRTRLYVGVAFVVMAVTLASACSSARVRLQLVGDRSPQGAAKTNVPIGSTLTEMTFDLCTTGGEVGITGITLRRPSSIDVVGWATKRIPPVSRFVSHYGQATSVPGFTTKPIAQRCGSRSAAELDLAVRTSGAVADFHGFDISYDGGTLFVPFRLVVCAHACPPGAGLEDGPLP